MGLNFRKMFRKLFLICHNTKPCERHQKFTEPEVRLNLEKTSSDDERIIKSDSGSSQEPLIGASYENQTGDCLQREKDFCQFTMLETIFCSEEIQRESSEKLFTPKPIGIK
jgi:hypothetical protein